jgi:uncharacterized protein DUF4136
MVSARLGGIASRLGLAAAALFGLMLAACDEHVQITRDPDLKILKHATWAWRPAEPPPNTARDGRSDRPVISRDVIRRGETVVQESDPAVDAERRQVRSELERQLSAKGLAQINDPATADFLVDYHFAVRRRNVTVREVYPGGYPGLVCGPFGCWSGWSYGPPGVSYHNIRFREGTFVFDMFKQADHRQAYRAIGQEPVQKAQFSHDQIEDMVHALLKDLHTVG